jgi:hypothetical protein
VGKDCEEVMRLPLLRPPLPVDTMPFYKPFSNLTHIERVNTRGQSFFQKIIAGHHQPFPLSQWVIILGSMLLILLLSVRICKPQNITPAIEPRRTVRLNDIPCVWVPNHVPRIGLIISYLLKGEVIRTNIPFKRKRVETLRALHMDHYSEESEICESDELGPAWSDISDDCDKNYQINDWIINRVHSPDNCQYEFDIVELILRKLHSLGYNKVVIEHARSDETPWACIASDAQVSGHEMAYAPSR